MRAGQGPRCGERVARGRTSIPTPGGPRSITSPMRLDRAYAHRMKTVGVPEEIRVPREDERPAAVPEAQPPPSQEPVPVAEPAPEVEPVPA